MPAQRTAEGWSASNINHHHKHWGAHCTRGCRLKELHASFTLLHTIRCFISSRGCWQVLWFFLWDRIQDLPGWEPWVEVMGDTWWSMSLITWLRLTNCPSSFQLQLEVAMVTLTVGQGFSWNSGLLLKDNNCFRRRVCIRSERRRCDINYCVRNVWNIAS